MPGSYFGPQYYGTGQIIPLLSVERLFEYFQHNEDSVENINLLLGLLALMGTILLFLSLYLMWRIRKNTLIFEENYKKLLIRLDTISVRANQMAPLVEHIEDRKALDGYESCLRLIEKFLETLQKAKIRTGDTISLASAFHIARECDKRIEKTYRIFRRIISQKKKEIKDRFKDDVNFDDKVRGCYFCSRPYDKNTFKMVKTSVSGVVVTVLGCRVCCQELKENKKIKVLYFNVNNQSVHWSRCKDFQTAEKYWNLNESSGTYREARLEVVYKRPNESDEK
ncbi:MAG: hypothetical protein HQK54_10330 [Oligoflexales bacterium]|nr:hypothetical protein [Oligoflexales bacterium]